MPGIGHVLVNKGHSLHFLLSGVGFIGITNHRSISTEMMRNNS